MYLSFIFIILFILVCVSVFVIVVSLLPAHESFLNGQSSSHTLKLFTCLLILFHVLVLFYLQTVSNKSRANTTGLNGRVSNFLLEFLIFVSGNEKFQCTNMNCGSKYGNKSTINFCFVYKSYMKKRAYEMQFVMQTCSNVLLSGMIKRKMLMSFLSIQIRIRTSFECCSK